MSQLLIESSPQCWQRKCQYPLEDFKHCFHIFPFCSVGVQTRKVMDELYERVLFFKSATLSSLPITGHTSTSSPIAILQLLETIFEPAP